MYPVILSLLLFGDPDEANVRAILSLAAAAAQTKSIINTPETQPSKPTPASTTSEADEVEDAVAKSLETRKPVIFWVGGNFCDRCVNDSKDEFIHVFLQEWKGHRGPATVILAPHEKRVYRVGTVERWTVGSHDWGHVPSARRVLGEWRKQARAGVLAPLQLLNFGDGAWGMSHDTFYRNYRGSGAYGRGSMSAPTRSRSGRGG